MQNKLISVVIPVYNRENLVVRALDSVFLQSYRPLEVIVVDDGSTDETVKTIQNWIDAHLQSNSFMVRLICQDQMGGNAARNRGVEESIGEYIAFLDSDDVWNKKKLEKQLKYFEDSDVGGVYCGVQHMDLASETITTTYQRNYPVGWILEEILVRDVTAQTSTYILRKEVFQKVGNFDLSLQARQDWDMWIRLASKYKIEAVPELLVQYGEHSGPRTASDPMREIRAFEIIRRKYSFLLKSQSVRVQRAARAAFYKRKGRVYFHYLRSPFKAIWFYLVALVNYPTDFDTWAAILGVFLPTPVRELLNRFWNKIFGNSIFAIRSH